MKRHARYLAGILAVLMTMTAACTVTVFAEDMSGGEGGEGGGSVVPQESYVEPPQESYGEPSYDEPSYVEPSYVEPSYVQPSYNEPSYVQPSYNEGGGYDPGYDGGTNSGGEVYYDPEGNAYTDSNDVYVGGDQTYDPPASTAPSAPLFDTSKTKVDENTLTSSDWNDIKNKLNGSTTQTSTETGDFAFIQNNNALGDNGHMILILGIVLIALSLAGFTFLIISAVRRRRQTAPAHAGKAAESAGSSGGTRYRANDDYDDDYSSDSKKNKAPKNGKRYK